MKDAPAKSDPEIGRRGRERREAIGMTKIELCHKLGIGTGRLNTMETEGVSGIGTCQRWAEALGMPVEELAFGTKKTATKKAKAR
jgi:transcriptional regulator with XRE-family HTH domain